MISLLLYYNFAYAFINRLDGMLWPNVGFTLLCNLAVFTRSAITPTKVNRFG